MQQLENLSLMAGKVVKQVKEHNGRIYNTRQWIEIEFMDGTKVELRATSYSDGVSTMYAYDRT